MAFIDEVKTSLRTTTTDSNLVTRINTLIDSAKEDLALGGVHSDWMPAEPTNPLIKQAIICYVCWQYFNDLDFNESYKWLKAYNIHRQKIHTRYTKFEEAIS